MEKLNRKGFFTTLFGGIAGVVAGSTVKASEPIVPTPPVENVVTCDKLIFTTSDGASCVMQFRDNDNFEIRVNNSENISINICSPLNKPTTIKAESSPNSYEYRQHSFYNEPRQRLVIASNGTINISANGISVSESQLQNIPNSALTNTGSIIGSTPVALGQTVTSIAGLTLTGAVITGSFSGSFTGTTDLPDLTAGNGLSASIYDGSTARTFAVQASGSTLTVGSAGVAVNAAGITATELNSSVAGNGLSGGAGTALSVNVDDTSIEINTDALRVKAGGVSNAMLVNCCYYCLSMK